MTNVTLTDPTAGTVITAGLHATNNSSLRNAINGGIDNNNLSSSAGVVLSKLGQSGATANQGILWNGSAWVAASRELGYTEITSSVTVTSTTESSGTTVITASAITFDGNPVICEFFSPQVQPAVGGNSVTICLFEGATEIGRLAVVQSAGTGTDVHPVCAKRRFTPSAASHTYTVTAFQGGGNATIAAGAGGTATLLPAYLRFERAT